MKCWMVALGCYAALSSVALAAESFDCENYDSIGNQCVFVVKGKSVGAAFPAENLDERIAWNKFFGQPEYSWSTEFGFCEKDEFRGLDYEFAAYVSNFFGRGVEKVGSLRDLINSDDFRYSFYFKSSHSMVRELFYSRYKFVKLYGVITEDHFVVMSNDESIFERIMEDKPTHVLMRFKSPYKTLSYECVSEIHVE